MTDTTPAGAAAAETTPADAAPAGSTPAGTASAGTASAGTSGGGTGRRGRRLPWNVGAKARPDEPRASLGVLLRLLRPHRPALGLALGLGAVNAAAALAVPLLVRVAIGDIEAGRSVALTATAVVVTVVVAAVISGGQAYVLQRTGEAVVLATRTALVRRLLRLPVGELDRRRSGDLISRVGADTTLLRTVVTSGLVDLASGAVIAVGALVAMAVVDPVLLGVTALAVAVGLAGAIGVFGRVRRASLAAQAAVGTMTAGVERALSGVRTIRAAGAEDREQEAVGAAAGSAFRQGLRLARLQALLGPVGSVAIQGAFLAVLGIGGARVAAGDIAVADLVAFVFLLFLLVQPLASGIQAWLAVQTGLGALARIEEVLALPEEDAADKVRGAQTGGAEAGGAEAGGAQVGGGEAGSGEAGAGLTGAVPERRRNAPVEVRLVDARFAYPDPGSPTGLGPEVLRGVSFTAPAGARTALVGPSGAGKSTILALVERFYDVTGGAVVVGGDDVREVDRAGHRARIAYVEQEAPALAGTVRDNLVLAAPEASDEDLHAALRAVNLDSLVESTRDGLEAQVGDDGILLSGGQRQRLAIARALLARPALLLLDEPTANLDARNEEALAAAVAAIGPDTTVLVIAHRLSTVVDADRIVVLDEGRTVAVGTHDELVASSALYRDLAARQLLVPGEPGVPGGAGEPGEPGEPVGPVASVDVGG